MAKYKQRPLIVEAEQFVVWNLSNIPDNVTILGNKYCVFNSDTPHPYIYIPTLGGNLKCYNLDWVCKGAEEELHVYKNSTFLTTFAKV
jgi:hypothetical protein